VNAEVAAGRRWWLKAATLPLALPGLSALSSFAHGSEKEYPARAVRMVVPFAAGGTTDIVARLLAHELGPRLKRAVSIENRGGAGGNIGAEHVAKSTADGATLLMASGSVLTANPHLYRRTGFDAERDFAPISLVCEGPLVLAVNPSHPAKTLAEFVAWARKQGADATFGSAGIGSQGHLVAERFSAAAGFDATHVPYKGESAAAGELIAGRISFALLNLGSGTPFVRGGQLRAIAVTSRERVAALADVPTAYQSTQAGLAGFEAIGWFALFAPAATPSATGAMLEQAVRDVAASAKFAERVAELGMRAVGSTAKALGERAAAESKAWGELIRSKKIQLD
jgi:tripartite-type tricarboxylate transporter receptor subunit TctC